MNHYTFVGDFCFGKIALSSLYSVEKNQMPKLKLHLVKMDLCILFATNAQIDAVTFVMCFNSYALFQHERMA